MPLPAKKRRLDGAAVVYDKDLFADDDASSSSAASFVSPPSSSENESDLDFDDDDDDDNNINNNDDHKQRSNNASNNASNDDDDNDDLHGTSFRVPTTPLDDNSQASSSSLFATQPPPKLTTPRSNARQKTTTTSTTTTTTATTTTMEKKRKVSLSPSDSLARSSLSQPSKSRTSPRLRAKTKSSEPTTSPNRSGNSSRSSSSSNNHRSNNVVIDVDALEDDAVAAATNTTRSSATTTTKKASKTKKKKRPNTPSSTTSEETPSITTSPAGKRKAAVATTTQTKKKQTNPTKTTTHQTTGSSKKPTSATNASNPNQRDNQTQPPPPQPPPPALKNKKKKRKKQTFEQTLVHLLFMSCKPYTVKTLAQQLNSNEASINFCLLSLADKGWILKKEFTNKNKTRTKELVWANHESKAKELYDSLQLASPREIQAAQTEVAELQRQDAKVLQELAMVSQEPSNEELNGQLQNHERLVKELEEQRRAMWQRIREASASTRAKQSAPFGKPKPQFSKKKQPTCPKQWKRKINNMRGAWKKRKEKCMDFVEQLADGLEKKVKDVVKLLELETDEAVGAKLPPKYDI